MKETTKIKIKEIYQWPKKLTNDLLPWYDILRRVVIWPLMVVSFYCFIAFYSIGWGLDNAKALHEALGWGDKNVL